MANTPDTTLGRYSKAVRIFRKRLAQEVFPRRKPLIHLEAQEGNPVAAQLRALLADKRNGARLIEQLEIWDTEKDGAFSRKEFRSALAYVGYSAPKQDLNVIFDEIDSNGNGEVDFPEITAAFKRFQSGIVPEVTGDGAAKLSAKAELTVEEKKARMMSKLAAKDATLSAKLIAMNANTPTRLSIVAAPPARVMPPKARPTQPKPTLAVTFDPASEAAPTLALMRAAKAASPSIMRVAKAASPAFIRAASAMSPHVAKAAGVSEIYQQVLTAQFTPNTKSRQHLETWAAFASMEKQEQLKKWSQLEPSPAMQRRPLAQPPMACA